MAELQIHLDRYDGSLIAPHLIRSNIRTVGDQIFIETPLGGDDEFAIYFGADADDELLAAARTLAPQLGRLDNEVQRACAAECQKSGLHPRNYEGELVFVTIWRDRALLRYYGTGVNTEWDELVELESDAWRYVGTRMPDLSSRKA